MRIVLAIKNSIIEEKLISKYYLEYEICVAHSVNTIDKLLCDGCILILRDEIINGDFEHFVTRFKEKYNNIQIIVIVKYLTQNIKEFLFSKEVFNIIEGTSISFNCLVDMIKNPKMVIYKEIKEDDRSNVIFVTGSFSTGKTTVSLLISKSIAKYNRVLLIDMNYVHPTIDLYVKETRNYLIEELFKDIKEKKKININNYISEDLKLPNLKYILNKGGICIPSESEIVDVIENLKKQYDYILIDTSSFMLSKIYNISYKNNYNIIHIIEADDRGVKNYIEDVKYIDKEKIHSSNILLNKYVSIFNVIKFKKRFNLKHCMHLNMSYLLFFSKRISTAFFFFDIRKILKKLKIKNKIRRIKK